MRNLNPSTDWFAFAKPRCGLSWASFFSLRFLLSGLGIFLAAAVAARAGDVALLNVSYDVTREFYQEFNAAFAAVWKRESGDRLTVRQSHGGSSKQVRSVLDGLEADVVTMNQPLDVDMLHERGQLIPKDWAARLPNRSVPYTSTILFAVRKGNPKSIRGWVDLIRGDVSVVIPNPKTSGNGRYSYLAAWGQALKQDGGSETRAREYVQALFARVPVLDSGGRGATTTFVQRGIGDVLLTFENEVELIRKEFGADAVDVVTPPVSILAESPVTWVDRNVAKHGTSVLAKAYLEHLFSTEGQELAAKHFFRPQDPAVLKLHADRFRALSLFTVTDVFGSWAAAQQTHFRDGGEFDRIYERKR